MNCQFDHGAPGFWYKNHYVIGGFGVDMAHPVGESKEGVPRLDFDRRLKLEVHGSKVTSDAGMSGSPAGPFSDVLAGTTT